MVKTNAQQNNDKNKNIIIDESGKPKAGNNTYMRDKNLDKFMGTWVGNGDDKRVKIALEKKVFHINKNPGYIFDIELITGSSEYSDNGKLIAAYSGDDLIGAIGI